MLIPLIDAKNACRRWLLENDIPSLRREFRRSQHVVKAAVDNAREEY